MIFSYLLINLFTYTYIIADINQTKFNNKKKPRSYDKNGRRQQSYTNNINNNTNNINTHDNRKQSYSPPNYTENDVYIIYKKKVPLKYINTNLTDTTKLIKDYDGSLFEIPPKIPLKQKNFYKGSSPSKIRINKALATGEAVIKDDVIMESKGMQTDTNMIKAINFTQMFKSKRVEKRKKTEDTMKFTLEEKDFSRKQYPKYILIPKNVEGANIKEQKVEKVVKEPEHLVTEDIKVEEEHKKKGRASVMSKIVDKISENPVNFNSKKNKPQKPDQNAKLHEIASVRNEDSFDDKDDEEDNGNNGYFNGTNQHNNNNKNKDNNSDNNKNKPVIDIPTKKEVKVNNFNINYNNNQSNKVIKNEVTVTTNEIKVSKPVNIAKSNKAEEIRKLNQNRLVPSDNFKINNSNMNNSLEKLPQTTSSNMGNSEDNTYTPPRLSTSNKITYDNNLFNIIRCIR